MSEPQSQMRQPPPAMRQSQGAAVRASWMAGVFRRQMLRGLAIATAAGVVLALTGAFGTYVIPLTIRLAYWIGLALLGAVFGALIAGVIEQRADLGERPWLWAGAMSLGMSVPFTVVVFALTTLVFGGDYSLARLLGFFPSVLLVTAVITGINFLAQRRETSAEASPPPEPTPVAFLERLPLKLSGGELWAVEAEDHYLRLHTSKGQDLILMRLGDAVGELQGVEGAQCHRSWWVARDAIIEVKRGDGRATLTLKDGAQIPVSRAYARTLREAGWF